MSIKRDRLNYLYHIIDSQGQDVVFEFNPVQSELFHNLHDSNIILKSRQHGITTFFCIFGLDTAIHVPNTRVGIIAHNREDAERFFRDKVRYAWDQLDPGYKKMLGIEASQDSARELTFSNNSAIRVGTSLRSSTQNILHISEFAKVCAQFPEKAREIVTGALNTVHDGSLVSIESTAEGQAGYFYQYCQEAMKSAQQGKELTRLDFKFHFFAWWQDDKNRLDNPEAVVIPDRLEEYFADLKERHGIDLTEKQKTWYAQKERTLGDDMKREHPSTPDEAFAASVEGAYFKTQFTKIYAENRICGVPYEPGLPVHTAWDLGVSDTTPIWFFQENGKEVRFIDFYESSGEGLSHYAQILRSKPYEYGVHIAPHDIEVRELSTGVSRLETAREYGINFRVAKRLPKQDQIEAARNLLNRSWFDEAKCSEGIRALESYRKKWDDRNGCWTSHPLHDWASHPADAYMVSAVFGQIGDQQTTINSVKSYINKNKSLRRMLR